MLEETIEDLEAMRQMDEEILETERDATKELRQELDLTNGRVNEVHFFVLIRSSLCAIAVECANQDVYPASG